MATDRQLARNFWLHEFPCYREASERQVDALEETVARVLQPARDRWGRIRPTSWLWWSSGCTPRDGAHDPGGPHPGTVDFVALDADTREVWEWGRHNILPAGYVGRWIYEPEFRDAEGRKIQGEHVHAAPRAAMIPLGHAEIQALEETEPDVYVFADWSPDQTPDGGLPSGRGTYGDPIELPGLTASAGRSWWGWILAGALAGAALRRATS